MAENNDRTSRRNLLIGASCALICAPAIVRMVNIMPVRRLVVPAQPHYYYGFVDRLRIDWLYRSGQLKGKALAIAREQGLLNHIVFTTSIRE